MPQHAADAIANLESAVESNPFFPESRIYLAQLYLQKSEFEKAAEHVCFDSSDPDPILTVRPRLVFVCCKSGALPPTSASLGKLGLLGAGYGLEKFD